MKLTLFLWLMISLICLLAFVECLPDDDTPDGD